MTEIKHRDGRCLYSMDTSAFFPDAAVARALESAVKDGVDLAGADLSGQDLSHVRLYQAKLVGSDLSGANFGHANLVDCDLSGVTGYRTKFAHADFRRVKMDGSSLSQCNFYSADFVGTSWQKSNLRDCCFARASLKEMDLSDTDLSFVDFDRAVLADVNLDRAILHRASTDGMHIVSSTARGVVADQIDWSSMVVAASDFTGAVVDGGARILSQGSVFKVGPIGVARRSRMLTVLETDRGMLLSDGDDFLGSLADFRTRIDLAKRVNDLTHADKVMTMLELFAAGCVPAPRIDAPLRPRS